MDQYVYLLLGFFLSIVWCIIFYYKRDLRRNMLKSSTIGGFSGFIAEYWYLKDYWRPPTVLGKAMVSIEDFIVGFFIIGISMSIYSFVFNKQEIEYVKSRKRYFYSMFIIGALAMMILPSFGYNSMIVSPIMFLLCTLIILMIRKDLIKKALYSGVLLLMVALPIYAILFLIISPNYWNNYWLLSNTEYNIAVFGKIPIIEIIWYFSWGSFGGVCYNFYSGTKPVPLKRVVNT